MISGALARMLVGNVDGDQIRKILAQTTCEY